MTKIIRKFSDSQIGQIKIMAEGAGSFAGYGAVYNVIDRDNEILAPGVFAESLPAFRKNGFIADSHEWEEPVATINQALENDYGLYISCDFHSDSDSQAIRTRTVERIERGQNVGLSVGFRMQESEINENGVRIITKGELFEVSIVTVPANPMAMIVDAKNFRLDLPETEREFELLLRSVGYSRSDAVAITNHGFKSIMAQRDSGSKEIAKELALQELRFLHEQAMRLGILIGAKP